MEVRVFYDDMGSIGFINTDFVKKMESIGIHCRVFNPFVPGLNLFLNNRDHRKITVIDGKVGFTGGYNLANEYFNYTHPYGQWKDTGIRLEGDAVQSLTVTFLEMWNAVSEKLRMILILVNTLFITIIKHSKQVLFSLMPTVLWIMSRSEKKFISV